MSLLHFYFWGLTLESLGTTELDHSQDSIPLYF